VFRAALVGCGRIGSSFADEPIDLGTYTHAGAYQACATTTLVAVCDVDAAAAERCAAQWPGARAFTDLSAMLAETSPEIVSVCTPDATHAAVLERVLESRGLKGILAEKPLALHLRDAERINDRARDIGVVLAVNYSRRYTRGHQQVRARLHAGAIGEIQNVTGRYTKGVVHNGTHWFDLARWLISEVTVIHAHPQITPGGSDADLDVHLRFANGASGALMACRADAFSIFEMDIVGTTGRILMHDSGHRVQYWEIRDSDRYPGYRKPYLVDDAESDMRDSTLNAVTDLSACIETGRQPRCGGDDAVMALRIAEMALRSAASGCSIPMTTTA